MPNGAGMEIMDPNFPTLGLLALKTLFKMPPRVRETLLFGGSRICLPLQKVLVRLLGGAFLVETRFTDGPMSGQSFACWTSEKYFMLGSHVEGDLQRRLLDIVKEGDIVYDIGGHAGYMSLLFSILVGATGRIFTFEPSPLNYARVRDNIDANRRSNVTIVNAAASDHEGVAFLRECGSMSALVSSANEPNGATSTIRTIRLDDFVYRDSNPAPDFIKIDVEGHAGPALEGMTRILESLRPTIICELHNHDEEDHFTRILIASRYHLSPIDADRKFPRRTLAAPQ
jgi:FkbM family methyltransferase